MKDVPRIATMSKAGGDVVIDEWSIWRWDSQGLAECVTESGQCSRLAGVLIRRRTFSSLLAVVKLQCQEVQGNDDSGGANPKRKVLRGCAVRNT